MTGTEVLEWMNSNVLLFVVLWLLLALILAFLYYQSKLTKLKGKIRMLESDLKFQIENAQKVKQEEVEFIATPHEEVTTFEKEQEELSVISYEELVKAVRGKDDNISEKTDSKELVEELPFDFEEKKFHATDIISPVYGKVSETIKEEPKTIKKDDLESFLSSLIELRKKLE